MCGILFYLRHQSDIINECGFNIEHSINTLIERGPDMSRIMRLNEMEFGFTRLAINGLTELGMQPFILEDCVLICNGEIYNYEELSRYYDIPLSTGSDCEIIIPLYRKIGDEIFNKLDGVFALILYDKINNEVYISRDPYGVRPLFIGYNNNGSLFVSSEMKAICNSCNYLKQFPPSNYCKIVVDNYITDDVNKTYYNITYNQYNSKLWIYNNNNNEDIYYNINELLHQAVNKRMMSDVEVGCLLSGGIDSSLICGLVNKYNKLSKSKIKLKTFSIGLEGSPDLKYAKIVADYLQTEHYEIIITEEDVVKCIDDVVCATETYDITTIRASVGNYLLGRYIKNHTNCKVIFNGDGADEIFGSYKWLSKIESRYEFNLENNKLLNNIHFYDVLRSDRSMAGNGLEARTPFLDKELVRYIMSINPELKMHNSGNNIEKYLLRMAFDDEKLIPEEVLWRNKEAFSDGVTANTRSLFNIIEEYIDKEIPDNQYLLYKDKYKCISKEHYYYIKIFIKYFGGHLNIIPDLWMPPKKYLGNVIDPSARLL